MINRAIMKLALILVLFLFALLFIRSNSYAFKNEPDGFRNIKWGANAKEQRDMTLISVKDGVSIWSRQNDKMFVGDVRLTNVKYYFYKDKFFKVVMNYEEADADKLKDYLFSVYGNGSRYIISNSKRDKYVLMDSQGQQNYSWSAKQIDISFLKMTALRYSNDLPWDYEPPSPPDGCDSIYSNTLYFYYCVVYEYKPIAAEYVRDEKKRAQEKAKIDKLKEREQQKAIEQQNDRRANEVKKDL